MITRLKERGIPVMLAGMYAPRNLEPTRNASTRSIASLRKSTGWCFTFFLEGIAGDRTLNQADGLHPTAEGVNVIVRNILPTVERFIASLPPRS
ncbi:Acyl-CoA thioesterase-1 OS=Bosea thiooxidans OX=53254 GN=SAMN05660750_04917 PE=4 SV=1 [Bosea thiooxidans]